MNGITWKIVAQISDDNIGVPHRTPIASYGIKGLPYGKELVTIAYGYNLNEIKGLIRKPVSFWAIDESGSVGRTKGSMGKAITYSAVTQLDDVDYEALFDGIPKEVNPKTGIEKIHTSYLRDNYPDKLRVLVDRISDSPFLIISLPEIKTKEYWPKVVNRPRYATFVFYAIENLVQAIEQVDLSEKIVVTFDRTNDVNDEYLDATCAERTIVRMCQSHVSNLLQVADVAASVTGGAISYPRDLNMELFWKFYKLNTNMSARSCVTTATGDSVADKNTSSRNYKKKSWPGKLARGRR